jgi:hypothetical protein
MKKCSVLLCCLLVFALHAQRSSKDFFYTVPFNVTAPTAWWHEGMELPQLNVFIQSILNVVDSGRVDVYEPEFPYTRKLERKEVQQVLHKTDTVYPGYGYLISGDVFYLSRYDLLPRAIKSISFCEKWEYDGETKTFLKTVKGIILNGNIKNDISFMGTPLFYIPFDGKGIKNGPAVSNPPTLSKFTYDFHTKGLWNVVIPPEILFRDDTTLQKKNQRAAKTILSEMLAGKKTVFYDTLYPYTKPLSKKVAAKNHALYETANTFRFLEDWQIDLNKMTFQKTIHGIVLEKETEGDFVNNYGEPQKYISFTRLAFLPLNGYAPTPLPPFNQKIASDFVTQEIFFKSPLTYDEQTIYTDSAKLMNMCIGVCNLVESLKLPAYSYNEYYGTTLPLTSESSARLFAEAHKSNISPASYSVPSYDSLPYYYQTTSGMRFKENWLYNSSAQVFEKQIDSITLLNVQYINHREAYLNLPLFTAALPQVKDTAAIMKPGFLVAKNIQSPVIINYFSSPKDTVVTYIETDMSYSPRGYYSESYMESSARYNFIQQIINDALAGKTTVYDGEKPQSVLSPSQLRTKLDSIKNYPDKMDLPMDYFSLPKIIFVEDWYFNPATGEFYKKVKEIIFVNSTGYVNASEAYVEHDTPVFSVRLK